MAEEVKSFVDNIPSNVLSLIEGAHKGSEWEVVIIEAGESLNGNYYTPEVLKEAVPLFEGVRACAYRFGKPLGLDKDKDGFDHLPDDARQARPSGLSENVVGFFRNVRYGTFTRLDGSQGEGVLARFHVLEGHEWLRKNLKDAWEHGAKDLLGFSIDARGVAKPAVIGGRRVNFVEKIEKVTSTDVVSEPAAGGSLLRLVASFQGDATVEDVFGLIRDKRPQWLEDFAEPEDGQDLQDYIVRVLEANLLKAEDVQRDIPGDEVKTLTEVARGVNTLNSVISLIRSGKVQEAMKLLRNWIAVYPVPDRGSAEQRMRGFFSFPYAAPQGGYPGAGKVKPYGSAHEGENSGGGKQESKVSEDGTMPDDPIQTPTNDEPKEPMVDAESTKLKEELEARDKELREREKKLTVREALSASDLPELARARVEQLLLGRDAVTTEEAKEAIKAEAEYIAQFAETKDEPTEETKPEPAQEKVRTTETDSGHPRGLGDAQGSTRVSLGDEPYDNIVKSWEGFFNGDAQPIDGIPAFTSLHEAFGKITGKWYSREDMADLIFESIRVAMPTNANRRMEDHLVRVRENWKNLRTTERFKEAVTTSDFSVAFGDALFRRLQKEYREDPRNDWRRIVSSIENFTDATNNFNIIRIGAVGTLPVVNQNAPYQEFTDPTEVTEILTPSKRGALLKFTWEDALADRIGVLRRIPSILGRSAVRTIHELVWDQIDTNPAMASGDLLISAANANVLVSADVLTYANLTTLVQQLRNQTEQDSGKKLGLAPAFLLVGPTKENEAVEITDSSVKVNAAEDATVRSFINKMGIQTFSTLGLGRSTSPDTQFRYYLAANPRDAETIVVGFLGGRDRPDIFVQSPTETPTSGAAFDADAMTFKIRLVVGAKVVDHRWIQGSLATA